ncbi:MAG: hypothetical protein ACYDCC_05010 [Actinomycetota bacterium]
MPSKTAGRGTPRLKVDEEPVGFASDPRLRKTLVTILSIGVALGGARVWENQARASSLRAYLKALAKAEQPFTKDIDPNSSQDLLSASRDFGQGKIQTRNFVSMSSRWEQDFRLAKTNVQALKPPAALSSAQTAFENGIEAYVGVARLFNLAGQLRVVEEAAKRVDQQKIEDKVQVEIQQAQEEETRAEGVYGIGGSTLVALKKAWLGIDTTTLPGVPAGITFSNAPAPPAR